MAFKAVDWAFERNLDPAAKLVLLALAKRADKDDMTCYPSLARIAADTGFNPSTIARKLRQLEISGYISRQRRIDSNSYKTTLYTVLVAGSEKGLSPTATNVVVDKNRGCLTILPKPVAQCDKESLSRIVKEPRHSQEYGIESIETEQSKPNGGAVDTWEEIVSFLQSSMDPQHFKTWVCPTVLFAINRLDDGRIIWRFHVPNEHFRRWWLEHNYLICQAAESSGISDKIICEFEQVR